MTSSSTHGVSVAAEFDDADRMLSALDLLRRAGYRDIETYTPFDVPGLDERLGLSRSWIPWLTLAGGLAGLVIAYGIQWWANVHSYPLNVGGRPIHAVPAFLLATFEGTILGASLMAFFGCLATLRLPTLWAPEDEIEGFSRTSIDRFWIVVGQCQSQEQRERAGRLLANAGAQREILLERP